MTEFTSEEISSLEKRYKANLINSVTGYKSANLIGSISENSISNLAVFNSILHIGSSPALIGFVLRPLTVERHTYANIKSSQFYTVNQIHSGIIEQAHQTSAKYATEISEFGKTGLNEEYVKHISAPFVKESKVQIACKYVNEYEIKENGCLLMIGQIEMLRVQEKLIQADGWVDHMAANTASILGLDGYAEGKLINRFAYARPDEPIKVL
ncbi:MAG: flavin reductase [Croceitalea sp.]|nr:flavin reductase [Croceitalea sp.]